MQAPLVRILVCGALLAAGASWALPLDQFQEEGQQHGFTCRHLYLDSQGRTAGACLVHESGFTVDLLPMETAPQAFVWVATPVSGHRGEPHTLEHLLLGKGRRGLSVANAEEYRFSSSSAFTGLLETCYHFSTALGEEDFLTEFGDRLDALLHPDFSDEEIRREVCHVGPKQGPAGLELEEKGTVYTEMLSSWDNDWSRASHRLDGALYGPGHPLAAYQGGIPADIRRLKPRDIRDFQRESHFLGNMGVELVLPAGAMNDPLLARLDSLLRRLEPLSPGLPLRKRGNLPPLRPSAELVTEVVEVPGSREGEPALLLAAWPPTRQLGPTDFLFSQLFLNVAGSGESSVLHRRLIDPTQAEDPLGAAWLSMWIEDTPGQTVRLGMGSLPPARVTESGLAEIRVRILKQLAEIAAWREGDAELATLKERTLALLAAQRRAGRNLLDHPPGFGERGTGSFWADHLRNLRETGSFRLRLDEEPALAEIERRLQAKGNPFQELVERMGLLATPPHLVGTRSNPALLERKETERLARLEAFADSLERAYGTHDRQEALRRFAADYDRMTAELEAQRAGLPLPALPATLPLDTDPDLLSEEHVLAGDVPLTHGVFEGMQGARFDLACDVGPLGGLPWLAALPALLTQAGLRGPGDTLDFRQVEDALRRELRWAGCWLDTDLEAGRAELVFTSSGTSAEECRAGIRWLNRFLSEADWSAANRPRLREIVRRELSGLRETRKGSEESWVETPAAAWPQRKQPDLLRAGCFLTQEHDLFRCAWALEDMPQAARSLIRSWADLPARWPGQPDSCLAWTRGLLEAPAEQRGMRLAQADPSFAPAGLDAANWRILELALRDLGAFAAELPAESFAADWSRLTLEMVDSAPLLEQLDLRLVNRCERRRAWFTGSRAAWSQVEPLADSLAGRRVDPAERGSKVDRSAVLLTQWRVKTRLLGADWPETCRGLLDPGSSSGVVIISAPLTWQHAWTREDQLNLLAGNLLGGGSDQGLFMQTWAAGLAYSNGIRPRERTGLLRYYAERCPDLSQTLSFVEERVRQAPSVDAGRTRTALITALGGSRAALDYDERTRQRAMELQLREWVDEEGRHMGLSQGGATRLEELRSFRRALAGLLADPGLPAELQARKLAVHARLFPGLAEKGWTPLPGTQFFVIGPERQFELAEEYLATRAPGQELRRLRPRDYWLVEGAE